MDNNRLLEGYQDIMKTSTPKVAQSSKSRSAGKMKNAKKQNVPSDVAYVAMSKQIKSVNPKVRPTNRGVLISRREPIWNVQAVNSQNVLQSFSLNPALNSTFPWLSLVATNYESYQFRRLEFEFVSARSTATDGRIIMSVDYDASDALPLSQYQQEENTDSLSMAVWACGTMKCSPMNFSKLKSHFTRSGPVPTGSDPKTYDLGIFTVGTYFTNSTSTIGSLYATYEVELFTPSLENGGAGASVWSTQTGNASTALLPSSMLGNLLEITANTTGASPNAIFTLSFLRDWIGVIAIEIAGTNITGLSFATTTALLGTTQFVINTAGTLLIGFVPVNAISGTNVVMTLTSSTTTTYTFYFGQSHLS